MLRALAHKMHRWSYLKRFALIGLVFAMVLSTLTFGLYRSNQKAAYDSACELRGMQLLQPLSETLFRLALYRHLRMLDTLHLPPHRARVQMALQRLRQQWQITLAIAAPIEKFHQFDPALRQVTLALQSLGAHASNDPERIHAVHNQTTQLLLNLINQVCHQFHLMRAPYANSFYLAENICSTLPRLQALDGESSALWAQASIVPNFKQQRRAIELRTLMLDQLQWRLTVNVAQIQARFPQLAPQFNARYATLRSDILRHVDNLNNLIEHGVRTELSYTHSHNQSPLQAFYQLVYTHLNQALQQRIQQLSQQRNLYAGSAIFCLLVLALSFRLLYLSIKEQLGGEPFYVQSVLRLIAQGSLSTPILLVKGDRSSVLADIGQMRNHLHATVAQLTGANCALCQLSEGLEAKVQERTGQLIEALQNAEAATKAKSHFLATMSHEIRTPLNAILGMSELLRDSPLDQDQHEMVGSLNTSSAVLLALINEILDFSKIEAGMLELEQRPFSVRQAMETLVTRHRPLADSRGLTLTAELSNNLPPALIGDSVRLCQIVSNLLSNAIKFTWHGGITLALHHEALDEQRVRLFIALTDTGIGIDTGSIPRLFDRFTQQDPSTTRRYGGSGLGLAICLQLIKAFRGEIKVRSQVGHGSTFSFYLDLPLAPAPSTDLTLVSAPIDIGPLRILVAEDNPMNQKLIRMMLARAGQQADLAENGWQAVRMALKRPYQLILMDIQMPEMDGIEATQMIKRNLSTAPRIVALTANAYEDDRQRCLAAGMDDFLSKPFKFNQLLHILQATTAGFQKS